MSTNKTPGQVAYEAYWPLAEPAIQWEIESKENQVAWELAAAAVLAMPRSAPRCPRCSLERVSLYWHKLKVQGWYIECPICMVDSGPHKTIDDALDAWRPPQQPDVGKQQTKGQSNERANRP